LETIANCSIEKERAEIANAVKYGKVSLEETVSSKDSERHDKVWQVLLGDQCDPQG